MHRCLAVVGPGAGRHDAPVTNALRGVVGIVEIGQSQLVAELVHPDPERPPLTAGILELRHLRHLTDAVVAVVGADALARPVNGPDVIAVATGFLAWAGVNRHYRVVVAEVDVVVGRLYGVLDEVGVLVTPDGRVAIERVGAKNVTLERQVAARVLVVVVGHRVTRAERQRLEPVVVMVAVVGRVVEIGQQDSDLDSAGRGSRFDSRQREQQEQREAGAHARQQPQSHHFCRQDRY